MLPLPQPDAGCALFFDFDGTLTDLASTPDRVRVVDGLPDLLARLAAPLAGAVAIVSGRPIGEIDAHLQPLKLPAAGVHGTERRGADGRWRRLAVPDLAPAVAVLQPLCERQPALRLERKPGALALHFRQAPQLEGECLAAMHAAQRRVDGMGLQRGKMVVELKPRQASKGHAVRAFLNEPPFRHRRPWFFGDDVTDEAAFEAVLALGGVAVKVGDGDTLAPHRLPDPAALHGWLQDAVAALLPQATAPRAP